MLNPIINNNIQTLDKRLRITRQKGISDRHNTHRHTHIHIHCASFMRNSLNEMWLTRVFNEYSQMHSYAY